MHDQEMMSGEASQRTAMVAYQIQNRGIENPQILQAFKQVPRHAFVTAGHQQEAYADTPLPIGNGQTISQPYVVALMLAYLDVKPEHQILEVGSGSGYATAILSKLCQKVTAVEVFSEFIQRAQEILSKLEITNVEFIHQSAWEQIQKPGVYDRIILWASPPKLPPQYTQLLKEGGLIVTPEGKQEQHIWLYEKKNGTIKRTRKDAVRFVPLVQGTTNEIDR